ncbi:MAG: hypothetical protein FWE67_06910, partial [Planctomycetaceae bacterium]|nr:hypothetical protein [Planctomycetaceae bacterium]
MKMTSCNSGNLTRGNKGFTLVELFVVIAAVLFFFVPFLYADEPAKTTAPPLEKPGWKLTFNDEFDSPLLDDTYWFAAYRTGR